jgi:diphthine-ammonia ligase
MNTAVLFSGGKDSVFATFLAKNHGITINCLLTIFSENKESYMFHTPSITKVEKQAEVMDLPLLIQMTRGKKESELVDLENLIRHARDDFDVQGIITGTVESAYQASRVQKICDTLGLDCFNPLWQKDQFELLKEIIEHDFDVIITGVFAYPLTDAWLGRHIDEGFLSDVRLLHRDYQINPAGEGGEFESLVVNCPLFQRPLTITDTKTIGKKNSWSMEVELE